ncbi:MAG: protein-export chaperone SecB [Proteobacteria bacterium]|nr:protein-export chaperone SecB [Pseudomonadota bacterium]
MAETPQAPPGAQPPAGQPAPLTINLQYVKDLSFEVPGAPEIFTRLKEPPEITVNVDVQARRLGETVYEVMLNVATTGKIRQETAFVAELSYGGVFTLNNIPPEHTELVVLVECPRLLFPFARHLVANATRDGGFPPLMISPIDFLAMYARRKAETAKERGTTEKAQPPASGAAT